MLFLSTSPFLNMLLICLYNRLTDIEKLAPGSDGEVGGFKLIAIKPGSVYEKLGLKRDDIIKGVNGELVDSAQKAMELYQTLKSSDEIQLEIGRNGKTKTFSYTLE